MMASIKEFFNPPSKNGLKKTPTAEEETKRSVNAKVTVRFDVGFPNSISIRGNGAGLNWHKGTTLKNLSRDLWVFETKGEFIPCEFKVLINDQLFEGGQNHQLKPGDSIEYTPNFY